MVGWGVVRFQNALAFANDFVCKFALLRHGILNCLPLQIFNIFLHIH
jgi:hypothetical protein